MTEALRRYSSPGHVAVVSAEEQRAVRLPVDSLSALPADQRHVLRTTGSPTWLAPEPVREELTQLQRRVAHSKRAAIDEALELVEDACATGTGVAIIPPNDMQPNEPG